MSSRFATIRNAAIVCFAFALHGCGSSGVMPVNGDARADGSAARFTDSKGGPGGGGGGGQIPPPAQTDGPSWFVYNSSSPTGAASPNIDFGNLLNNIQGGMAIGSTRTAQELVYNTSKKTALTLTTIAIGGTNASDFSISAASLQAALNKPIPANKQTGVGLQISFTPAAPGTRSGTLRLVSNAGTVLVALTGIGLPAHPVIETASALSFIPTSAPTNFTIMNGGSQGLILSSLTINGTNPGSFEITGTNSGQSNCFAGDELGPHSYCLIAVGVTTRAVVRSSAVLAISSNDPATPVKRIQMTLSP